MGQLLEKIDKYLLIQEKKDRISLSQNSGNINDAIEIIRKSDDKDKALSMFDKEIRKKIQQLIDGGIL